MSCYLDRNATEQQLICLHSVNLANQAKPTNMLQLIDDNGSARFCTCE